MRPIAVEKVGLFHDGTLIKGNEFSIAAYCRKSNLVTTPILDSSVAICWCLSDETDEYAEVVLDLLIGVIVRVNHGG
jgi:hypothetical protein